MMDDELRDVLERGLGGLAGDLGETIDRLVESVHAEAVADEENSKEAVTVEEEAAAGQDQGHVRGGSPPARGGQDGV